MRETEERVAPSPLGALYDVVEKVLERVPLQRFFLDKEGERCVMYEDLREGGQKLKVVSRKSPEKTKR